MNKILLIASGDGIAKYGYMLQKELSVTKEFTIVNAYMEGAVNYARNYLEEDIDVIMARGNTAKLLKAARLNIPVVTIPITDFELLRSIEAAKKIYGTNDSQIGYIGLEDIICTVKAFLDMLQYHVRLYPVNSSEDIQKQIQQAKLDHVDVIIGGVYTQQLAKEHGLNCIILESSLSSIREAYERALEVCRSVNLQKKKLQERITILNAISDGIINISEKGIITSFNPAAEICLQTTADLALKTSYSNFFAYNEQELIQKSILSGQKSVNHLFDIHGIEYSMDIHPVIVKNKNRGIILTLRKHTPYSSDSLIPAGTALPPSGPCHFSELTGQSGAFQLAVSRAKQYACLDEPILLIGEEGTGKETLAHCIHHESYRKTRLFITREAQFLSEEDLLAAHRGTLYLSHIHEADCQLQKQLTELLKTGSLSMSDHTRRALDIRLIFGTTVNLYNCVQSLDFRKDLYYRVSALTISLPPLCQREEDIPQLFQVFLQIYNARFHKHSVCAPSALTSLPDFSWPGNLCQLENLCRKLVIQSPQDQVFTAGYIKQALDDSTLYTALATSPELPMAAHTTIQSPAPGFLINGKLVTYEDLKALDLYYHGKKMLIAQKLGISRSTLWRYYKMMEEN